MELEEEMETYFKDLLECPVCFLAIDSAPIYQCHNGHVVCKDCHPKLETCPICRDAKLYDTPMAIRNLKLEEIVKKLQLSNSETTKKNTSESIQIEAIVPKTPNCCVETRQVPVEDGENVFLEGCKGQLISE